MGDIRLLDGVLDPEGSAHGSIASHHMGLSPLLSEAGLKALLDVHPRARTQCYTMSQDPERLDAVRAVDPADADGQELWRAARSGRIWLNLRHVHRSTPAFAQLHRQLRRELRDQGGSFRSMVESGLDLLISSAGSHTHYHVDRGPNVLFHVTGRKRLWLYPACDDRCVDPRELEAVYADLRLENLPWRPEYDELATCHTLRGGEAICWPNGAPHRVEAETFCVSLSFAYSTAMSDRRADVHGFNRHLARPLGLQPLGVDSGVAASTKAYAYRALRRLGVFAGRNRYKAAHATQLRIDSRSKHGYRRQKQPALPLFLKRS